MSAITPLVGYNLKTKIASDEEKFNKLTTLMGEKIQMKILKFLCWEQNGNMDNPVGLNWD